MRDLWVEESMTPKASKSSRGQTRATPPDRNPEIIHDPEGVHNVTCYATLSESPLIVNRGRCPRLLQMSRLRREEVNAWLILSLLFPVTEISTRMRRLSP